MYLTIVSGSHFKLLKNVTNGGFFYVNFPFFLDVNNYATDGTFHVDF